MIRTLAVIETFTTETIDTKIVTMLRRGNDISFERIHGLEEYNNCSRSWRGSLKAFQVATDLIASQLFCHCTLILHQPRSPRRYTIEKKSSVLTGYQFLSESQNNEYRTKSRRLINLQRQSRHLDGIAIVKTGANLFGARPKGNLFEPDQYSPRKETKLYLIFNILSRRRKLLRNILVSIFITSRGWSKLIRKKKQSLFQRAATKKFLQKWISIVTNRSSISNAKRRRYFRMKEKYRDGECVPKRAKRTPKRIPATHNFVYEFNPFGNSAFSSNSAGNTKGLQNFSNIGQGDFSLKPLGVKQNSSNAQVCSSATLPKLRSGSAPDNLEKQGDMAYYNKNMNLPNIKKQEVGTSQVLARDRNERRRRNPISEIDHEVEKVKSDWRTLRTGGGWARSKNFVTNTRTRKLYDTLEKMTLEIDRIQKLYLDPKSNQYLQRGASKALNILQPSFEEKADKIKDVLFPKGNVREKFAVKKMIENSSSGPNDSLRATLPCEMSTKGQNTDNQLKMRSLIHDTRARNIKATKPGNTLSSNFKRNISEIHLKSDFVNNRRTSKEMSSDTEQYSEKYINDTEENFTNEGSKTTDFYSSSDDVADMFKKFNLHSFDMYDIAECQDDGEKDYPLQNAKNVGNTSLEYSVRAKVNDKIESTEVTKEMTTQSLSPMRYNPLVQENNALRADTSIQTNTKSSFKDTAFIEMGLRALNTNFPQNSLSRVLQSQYLKKDVSLKPM